MDNSLTYTQRGDYFYPDLELRENTRTFGKYGRMRLRYLKEHRNGTYSALLLSDKLTDHLADIDETARSQVEQISLEMAIQRGVTEQMKAEDQMLWVGLMNNIRQAAEEIVTAELIYS